jgi:hypothetical protein
VRPWFVAVGGIGDGTMSQPDCLLGLYGAAHTKTACRTVPSPVSLRTATIKSKKSQKSLSDIGNRRAIGLPMAESHFPNACKTHRRQSHLGK